MPQAERYSELVSSVLAGNMFDWGAKEVVDLMEAGGFGFEQAREKIPGKTIASFVMNISENKTILVVLEYEPEGQIILLKNLPLPFSPNPCHILLLLSSLL